MISVHPRRVRTMSTCMLLLRRAITAVTLFPVLVGLAGSPAHARVFVGVGIPFYGPGYYGPPAYYPPPPVFYPPPPVYYAPPPVVYAPPQAFSSPQAFTPPGVGQVCHAGAYSCPMDRPVASGGSCYCLGNGGEHVWGRAN
jgi:hypothetical protein